MQLFRPLLIACIFMACAGRVGVGAEEMSEGYLDRMMEEAGLRWLMPVKDEVMHTDAVNMILEVFLPPTGDYSLGLVLRDNYTDTISLSCSWDCPHGAEEECECRCSFSCDCSTCARDQYSEQITFVAQLRPGEHKARAALSPCDQDGCATGHGVEGGVAFQVVASWPEVFEALRAGGASALEPPGGRELGHQEPSRERREGIRGPRHILPGLSFTCSLDEAAGRGQRWPSLQVVRPRSGETFREGADVPLEIHAWDLSSTDGALDVAVMFVLEEEVHPEPQILNPKP